MRPTQSPLRYPGGKASFTEFFGKVLERNNLGGGLYAEPFAGGAGAAVGLLVSGHVDRIAINDGDLRVFAFWKSALTNTRKFIKRIETTPITIDEWNRQREIYLNPSGKSQIAVGFAAFFLNRCNRSGILVNGGPIGGRHQSGPWRLDVRFNKVDLIRRIERLAEYGDRIQIFGEDAEVFVARIPELAGNDPSLVYLDPPYFDKGRLLYMNHFKAEDHARISRLVRGSELKWVMTYDDCSEIRLLYSWANCKRFSLKYSAYESRAGGELLIWPTSVKMPRMDGSSKMGA